MNPADSASRGGTPTTVGTPEPGDDGRAHGISHETPPPPSKKKKRSLGTFPCQHCDKVFSRSDHLARHNLNHEPKEVFICDFRVENNGQVTNCGKTFVRKDLKERHIRRHFELLQQAGASPSRNGSDYGKHKHGSFSSESTGTNDLRHHSHHPPQQQQHSTASPTGQQQQPQHQHQQPGKGMQISNLIDPSDRGVSYPGATDGSGHRSNVSQLASAAAAVEASQHRNPSYRNPQASTTAQPLGPAPAPAPGFDSSPSYPMTTNLGYPQHNLDTLFKNYGTTVPQNDILNWLFNDVSQSGAVNHQESAMPQPHLHSGAHSLGPNLPMNSQYQPNIPSPYAASQPSPVTHNGYGGPGSFSHPSFVYPPGPGMNGMMDGNVFSNENNPLDEMFYPIYNARNPDHRGGAGGTSLNTGGNNLAGGEFPRRHSSLAHNPSSSSPTNTMESSLENGTLLSDACLSEESSYNRHMETLNATKNKQFYLDNELVDKILQSLNLKREDLTEVEADLEGRLSYYIYSYWKHFHPEFTILHRPSFDTRAVNPLLLASMIIVGAQYSFPGSANLLAQQGRKSAEWNISYKLARPLRFALFEHKDFKSPVRVWMLQSLNMLEWVEKNFLSRAMHERAHLHHGTTAQLLRRSAMMGGNPASMNKQVSSNPSSAGEESETNEGDDCGKENEIDDADQTLFDQWVESESLKRATLMTFYLDIIDYVKFRHNPQILFYQLQLLNLPCSDEFLWESNEVNGSFKKLVKRQRKYHDGSKKRVSKTENFLSGVKKLLKGFKYEEIKNESVFFKKVLLAGLISLMHQMQQVELQNNSSLFSMSHFSSNSKLWKEMLIRAFDNWNFQIMQDYKLGHGFSMYNTPKNKVPLPIFHLTQIIGMPELTNYDIAIFGGSPANQSVAASMKDHHVVQRKMHGLWNKHKNIENFRSIVYCLIFLWQVLLGESDEPLDWEPNSDYYDSSMAISIAVLVLWSYCFVTCGLESSRLSESTQQQLKTPSDETLDQLSAENGYTYLTRIKQEFVTNLRKLNLHNEYSVHPYAGSKHNDVINKYCEILPLISSKQNISGLCFLIGRKVINSQWEILREHGKLIINCGLRSIGKKNILCSDLFDNELK
ncbi:uncharacterized protein LODBEIA_P34530 [Lodderomyces beijingensis]|uniref:C2H2-type domain-containing protein n=1 Tax=Lodderomyces beijingensis TaxID=1775926 RepID=A0ABP0ZMT9_9ASCO